MPTVITVSGVPFRLSFDSNGYYIMATSEEADASDSPTVVTFDPPIGPLDQVDFGMLYQQIMRVLRG